MSGEDAFRLKIRRMVSYLLAEIAGVIAIFLAIPMLVGPRLACKELPLTTKGVIALGDFLNQYWYIIALVILFLVLLAKIISKTRGGQRYWDGLMLKLPVISLIVKKINIIYTIKSLNASIASNVSLTQSLAEILRNIKNYYYREAIIGVIERVGKGEKLSSALRNYPNLFPSMLGEIVEVGEEMGKLPVVLGKLVGFLEEDVLRAVKDLKRVGEAVLIVIAGGLIGFFAVSVIQPLILF